MTRPIALRVATVGLAALLMIGGAVAGERGPVCREESVVEEMTRQIHALEYYSRVDPHLVTEQPTDNAHVVRCGVCVQIAPYDTLRFGDNPVRACRPHGFDVEIFPSGFVVHDMG